MWKKTSGIIAKCSQLSAKQRIAGLIVFSLVVLTGVFSWPLFSASATNGSGDKVLTVYDGDKKQAFRTDAKTVNEALNEQGITVDAEDTVEPSLDDQLTGTDYNINIYRARPILIEDGITRERIMSSGQTAQAIAKEAHLTLHDEDKVDLAQASNTVEDGVATQLRVTRAKLVTVNLYGKETEMRTQAKTIGEFLSEKNIELGENDELSQPKPTKISDGSKFSIWRNGKQTITVDEEVDFDTEKIEDADKDTSYKEVKETGEKGSKQVVYEVEMKAGQEISRTKISEVVTKQPKKQVEVVGIKSGPAPYTGGGSKDQWLAASGIPSQYWAYVDAIVSRESGWNPNATNSSSGACGLAQALPCSKVPGNGYNPVDSLTWMNGYVNDRYGGWAGAYTFWNNNHWY